MKTRRTKLMVSFFGMAYCLAVIVSCVSTGGMAVEKTGAELWAESCISCHNTPAPDTFSDDQWEVVIMHMRVRANLSQEDAKKVVEFLKSAN